MDSMGQRLKKMRLEKAISQRALAEALSVGQTTIANYEADIRQPNLEKLALLADFFQITVDELLGRETDKLQSMPPKYNEYQSGSEDQGAFDYEDMANTYMNHLFEHEKDKAQAYIINLSKVGVPIQKIYSEIFVTCLHEIGRLWESGIISIGEEHYISEVTKTLISHFSVTGTRDLQAQRTIVIVNLFGEDHDIAGKILENYFERSGMRTYYLGHPLPLRSLVENLLSLKADLIAFSITMDENIEVARGLIDKLKAHPKMMKMKVIVGGQALDRQPGKWKEIGADGYAKDFDGAVEVVRGLFKDQQKEPDHEEK